MTKDFINIAGTPLLRDDVLTCVPNGILLIEVLLIRGNMTAPYVASLLFETEVIRDNEYSRLLDYLESGVITE